MTTSKQSSMSLSDEEVRALFAAKDTAAAARKARAFGLLPLAEIPRPSTAWAWNRVHEIRVFGRDDLDLDPHDLLVLLALAELHDRALSSPNGLPRGFKAEDVIDLLPSLKDGAVRSSLLALWALALRGHYLVESLLGVAFRFPEEAWNP